MCTSTSRVWDKVSNIITKKMSFNSSNGSERFQIPIFQTRPATKMALLVDSSYFFHPKSTKIDEKLYDDLI